MIDWRNPTTIKAVIRLIVAGLLIVGIQLPDGAEDSAFGFYLALETIFTLKAGKKQAALEKKVGEIADA
ncbi:MAG: hypothetical protein V9G98_10310 [Candidatus Competibacter sp.]